MLTDWQQHLTLVISEVERTRCEAQERVRTEMDETMAQMALVYRDTCEHNDRAAKINHDLVETVTTDVSEHINNALAAWKAADETAEWTR